MTGLLTFWKTFCNQLFGNKISHYKFLRKIGLDFVSRNDTPNTNFAKFSWILFLKMTLGETPNFWILFPRFANMG